MREIAKEKSSKPPPLHRPQGRGTRKDKGKNENVASLLDDGEGHPQRQLRKATEPARRRRYVRGAAAVADNKART